ncbi:DNA repair protein RecO [Agrobacterium vitis]|uniref:DNA repair protein RecO n=1 Tax=Agrobacterium vitis TaxID=373 RepID=A0AAE2UVS6_AGRVI|nr:DNA repair protein RecO [Agrobacterium vitis]MBF2716641.1 DNA repair protein RecO [Agrobacterium vitis]MUZ64824.1 DNA repair protein RecO [Agrobacterium vitis]MVA21937.1 DNA repair protein RecO [Agrobacterium vitis]
MEWTDQAIVLGVRRHGETSVIAEMMTLARGRHLGLVRGGRSRTMQPVLQPGNVVEVTWRARLEEHLGDFRVEPLQLRAGHLMSSATAVYGVQALASLLRLLPEREPHGHLYEAMNIILDHLHEPASAGELFIRFELAILNDLGFGLDLTACAATGGRQDLVFVSPKTGRAVSHAAGLPYADRLLTLPVFLQPEPCVGKDKQADAQALQQAFRLTGYFLQRHVYEPRGLTAGAARDGFCQAALKALETPDESVLGGAAPKPVRVP